VLPAPASDDCVGHTLLFGLPGPLSKCGVSYVPGDIASFAEAAGHLLTDCARYRPALEQARQAHSWTAAADQYIKLYDGMRLTEKDQPAIRLPSV
jgi:glycosyltransferase involved in cell wall biosynthesis